MELENDSFQKESAFQGADFQVSYVELQWTTWRIIPVSKWLVTPLYKPWMAIWKGSHNPR